ncbi:MAG: hypothetical protein AVDCRST_MAG93-4221 [uncultured Chloroflexia bacterium]|uniref:Uncharacterized protein n=1 Tax=uncultured Chloroflexia bacterium TaxID=1672391 RepID=A0A6J4K4G6_9CHLR|nr:MAG: hypothetical protein AVDCRST_MAG93-4221 [uncultured Chloroflexia bacterium]
MLQRIGAKWSRMLCTVATLWVLAVPPAFAEQSSTRTNETTARPAAGWTTGGGTVDGIATPLPEFRLNLTAGRAVTITTSAASTGSDPVLHLLTTRGVQLAVDDNSGGGTNARLSYRPSVTMTVIVALRARTTGTAGTANLLINGAMWRPAVRFGGWQLQVQNLRANETIGTIRLPNGAGPSHIMYVLKADGLGVERWQSGGGVAGATSYRPTVALGTRRLIIAVPSSGKSGPVRFFRNDTGLRAHDPDNDGLGTELETALGTCSNLTSVARNFECNRAADARDTDGDGISDGWEVLGRGDVWPHQALPLWGANPLHKDLFVEVDFMLRAPGETAQRMSPTVARQFASVYQDEIGTTSALIKAYHGAVLVNPDGLAGVAVHMDTGVAPAMPADATLYGDWGGYTAVPPVQASDGSWGGVHPDVSWKTNMAAARRGIFRYALPYSSGGGSVALNSFTWAAGIHGAFTLAHESGHAMGLDHNGPPAPAGVVDANCKPNYPSLMNYAYLDGTVGFADGLNTPVLNNAALREWRAVAPSNTAMLDKLQNAYRYYVDRTAGHVDWNRDGAFAPEGTTVRAYANLRPGTSCEFTRQNAAPLPAAASTQSPAMARLSDRLYVFYSVLGQVRYNYSTSSWNCPVPASTPCGTWNDWTAPGMDAQGGIDVERINGYTRTPQLLVVSIDHEGKLWQARLTRQRIGGFEHETFSTPTLIPNSSPASGAPSLAVMGSCDTYLTYKGTDNIIRYRRFTCTGGWEAEQQALTPGGTAIGTAPFSFPAITRVYLPHRPGEPGIYGAFPNVDGYLEIWWLDRTTGRWVKTNVLESTPWERVEGRAAMAWVPSQNVDPYPGRFYLMYVKHDSTPNRAYRDLEREVRMLQSYTRVTGTPGSLIRKEVVGLSSPFDNVWFYAFGIDLLYEQGVDTNLRMVDSIAINKSNVWATIELRPKADGIQDYNYRNANDWETVRLGVCRNVVNPGGTVSNPITCP